MKTKVQVLRVLFHTACTHKEQGSRTVQDPEQVVVPNSKNWFRQRSDLRITIAGSFPTFPASLRSPLHRDKTVTATSSFHQLVLSQRWLSKGEHERVALQEHLRCVV